jgi:hypothetical protein
MSQALREILVSFGSTFDPKGINQGQSAITGMLGKLQSFATGVAAAFAVKEVVGFTMGLAEQAVELEHHAEALGISAQALQKWDFAANLSGVSSEELQIGLQRLQRSAVGAGGKGGDLGATFAKLHVTVKNANGSFKNADELLTDVAGAIGDMTDPTLQTATAMQIFGRGGARLLPFLKQGRAGVAALKAEVEALGGGFTDDFIKKSDEMVQDSKRLEFAFLGLKVKAIGPLLPLLTRAAEGATKWVVAAGKMLAKSNAAKAALIALGIGGAVALAPLVWSIAPVIASFLALEDVLTFLTGGKSITGDLVDKFFGKGAAGKVQAFVAALSKDVGPMLHDIFAIFTNGKPLDEKFKELETYVLGTLTPNFKRDFGEMGDSVASLVSTAASLAETLKDIVDAMKWIGGHTIAPIASAVANRDDERGAQAAKDKASGNQTADETVQGWFDGLGVAVSKFSAGVDKSAAETDAASNADGGASWYDKLRGLLVPNADAIRGRLAAAGEVGPDAIAAPQANVATAPYVGGGFGAAPPEVTQTNNTPITQNFYGVDKPEDAGKAAAKGAQAGVKTGTHDRAQRYLRPQSGGT